MTSDTHPLNMYLPKIKTTKYNLRRNSLVKPKVCTVRFQNTFINRLAYNYNII